MNRNDFSPEQLLLIEWFCSLLDVGHTHGQAEEVILLRTPVKGVAWKLLEDDKFRTYLKGIRFWGPLAKDDHLPSEEPLPRVMVLNYEGNDAFEAKVRRIRDDLFVLSGPEDWQTLASRKEIEDGLLYRFIEEDRVARLIEENRYLTDEIRNARLPGEWRS